jgi:hypothetical protein
MRLAQSAPANVAPCNTKKNDIVGSQARWYSVKYAATVMRATTVCIPMKVFLYCFHHIVLHLSVVDVQRLFLDALFATDASGDV